jgi:hypothetical protein
MKAMDREVLEYFVVRVMEIANRSSDLHIQRDLMKLAHELVATIEQRFSRAKTT